MTDMSLTYRQLEGDEASRLFPKRGQMDLGEFNDMFGGFAVGDVVSVDLDGLTPRAMKRRLGQSARETLGAKLRYRLSDDATALTFQIFKPTQGQSRRVSVKAS